MDSSIEKKIESNQIMSQTFKQLTLLQELNLFLLRKVVNLLKYMAYWNY